MELNEFCSVILLQAYGGLGAECASLNTIAPYNLLGGSTIMKSGFVRVFMFCCRKCVSQLGKL